MSNNITVAAAEAADKVIRWKLYRESEQELRERVQLGIAEYVAPTADTGLLAGGKITLDDLDRYFCKTFCEDGRPKPVYADTLNYLIDWVSHQLTDRPTAEPQAAAAIASLAVALATSFGTSPHLGLDSFTLYIVLQAKKLARHALARYCGECEHRAH